MTQLLGLAAAALAGTGGCLLGIRVADRVNQWLGRNVPTPNEHKQE
jgi:hypothetical protein